MIIMLAEASFYAERLDLPIPIPVTMGHSLAGSHVNHPRLGGFGGSLMTDFYFFGFYNGHLRFVERRDIYPRRKSIEERNREFSLMKSDLRTNEVYSIATNWLHKIDIDVAALEKEHPCRIEQRFYFKGAPDPSENAEKDAERDLLPIFDVLWGERKAREGYPSLPHFSVAILAPARQLIHLRMDGAETFSRRPKDRIRKAEDVLKIKDAEFIKFSLPQRAELVRKYSRDGEGLAKLVEALENKALRRSGAQDEP